MKGMRGRRSSPYPWDYQRYSCGAANAAPIRCAACVLKPAISRCGADPRGSFTTASLRSSRGSTRSLATLALTSRSERCSDLASRLAALGSQQGLLRILRRYGYDGIVQFRFAIASANHADISQIAAAIRLKHRDFRSVIRSFGPEPAQPALPPAGHGIRQFDFHDAGPFPVPPPPGRRMQA